MQIDELELEQLRSAASVAVDDVTELPELRLRVSASSGVRSYHSRCLPAPRGDATRISI